MTGEIRRSFLKHKVYGSVVCVDIDETGEVLAALVVSQAATCRHLKDTLDLNAGEAPEINKHMRDYEPIDLGCSEPTHWLADLGEAEKLCAEAESAWKAAHADAKAKKEMLEQHQTELRRLVREAVNPKPMPLFAA